MAKYAIIGNVGAGGELATGACVDNVMVLDPARKDEMGQALGSLLVEADELGLSIGDMYNGKDWTRNVDGEQKVLPFKDISTASVEELRGFVQEQAQQIGMLEECIVEIAGLLYGG